MQLGIVTYNIAAKWDLDTILAVCGELAYAGVELRTTHGHGVEVSLSSAERAEVRAKFADSPVRLVGLGSAFEYHGGDQNQHGSGNMIACYGCHAGQYNLGGITDNGDGAGNTHGLSFSGFTQTSTRFLAGGFLSDFYTDATNGYCNGGDCNHAKSPKNWTLAID